MSQADVTSEQINLIFGIQGSLGLFYIVLEGNSDVYRNQGTLLWTVSNSGFRIKMHNCTSTVTSVVNLGGRAVWHTQRPPLYDKMGVTQRVARVCLRQLRLLILVDF